MEKDQLNSEYMELGLNQIKTLIKDRYLTKQIKELKKNETETKIKEETLNKIIDKLTQHTPQPQTQNTTKKIIDNFDNYYKEYIQYRKETNGISQSSIKGYNSSIRYLKYFLSQYENIDLTFSFFKQLQKEFQIIPKNFFKYEKYYKKTLKELKSIKDKENYDNLNNKTINNHLKSYKSFFDYLEYMEIIDSNPVSKLKSLNEMEETNKEEFDDNDITTLLSSDTEEIYKDFYKIGLYTGMRIGEIIELKKENIEDNLIKIRMKDTKNKKHNRDIPIHPNIKNIIDRQIKENSTDYLFFDGNLNAIGKRINTRIRKYIKDKSKTFHSFRKNFSQQIDLIEDDYKIKKYLMGHSHNDITHNIYNRNKVNMEKVKDCINKIEYKGV